MVPEVGNDHREYIHSPLIFNKLQAANSLGPAYMKQVLCQYWNLSKIARKVFKDQLFK